MSTVSNLRLTVSDLCKWTGRQVSDSSVNGGNKDVFIVILVLSVLHALEYDAVTRIAVKRLANQSRVNCLYNMIGQSDMLNYGAGIIKFSGLRGL